MSDKTGIEWCEATWNPTTGCDRVSAGCDHCYAITMAKRLKAMGNPKYQTDGDPRTSGPGFGIATHPSALNVPRGWREPRLIFVNSMSDLFHARVPLSFVRDVFAVIADTPRHTYQILTKRAARLAKIADQLDWPTNLWMGVSVEDQDHADRIDYLRRVPAAVRFLSCEPLLGPVDLCSCPRGPAYEGPQVDCHLHGYEPVHWVIAGGESGPGARPMHPEWARSLRDQCAAAGVPFLFKQWGEWTPRPVPATDRRNWGYWLRDGSWGSPTHLGAATLVRVGKHAAGRVLDGRTWDEYPERTHV